MKRISVRVSVPFLLLLAVLYISDLRHAFFPTLIAVVLHELGHIAAIRACGGRIERVDIRIFGARLVIAERPLLSYGRDIIIAASGPATGLLTALAARLLSVHGLDFFIGINAVIAIVNLIPVYPLDGGRIALSAMLMFLPVRVAYTLAYVLSIIATALLLSLCIYLAMNDALNPTLVIFTCYIAVCAVNSPPTL